MRAREFKQARARLGLSQARLAKALGMSPLQVLRYEHGRASVNLKTAKGLGRAIPQSLLVRGDEVIR